jgi:urea carboxylase
VAALTEEAQAAPAAPEIAVPEGCEVIEAPFGGVLWSWSVAEGTVVEAGQTIAVIEAMKMESPVLAPHAGTVRSLFVAERQPVAPGAALLALEPA